MGLPADLVGLNVGGRRVGTCRVRCCQVLSQVCGFFLMPPGMLLMLALFDAARRHRVARYTALLTRSSPSGRSGSPFEGDLVAECPELTDGVAFGPFGVVAQVVVGAGLGVVGAGGDHVPDGDQDGVLDRSGWVQAAQCAFIWSMSRCLCNCQMKATLLSRDPSA